MTDAVVLEGITKRYGEVEALRGFDLRVAAGELFGFLGPNGAGKSTTIRILLDLIRPTRGRASVFGYDCQRQPVEARRHIGYLSSDPVYPPADTTLEVLAYASRLRRVDLDRPYLERLADQLQLDLSRRVGELSRGNRQKVGLLQSMVGRPAVLILDEPTTGLDPLVQESVEAMLREVASEGRTVFFSSHILSEVQSLCTRAAVVRGGELVDTFELAQERRLAPTRVEVTLDAVPTTEALRALPAGVVLVEQGSARLVLEAHDEAMDALVKWLGGHRVLQLSAAAPTLEQLFMRYYRSTREEA